jgi:hypothetical protein
MFILAFSIGPLIGSWATQQAEKDFQDLFNRLQRGELTISLGGGFPPVRVRLPDLPEFSSLDNFCDNPAGAHEKERVCGPYRTIDRAHTSANIGLVLTPVVPLLVLWVLALSKKSAREPPKGAKALAWVLMKLINKIIGLKNIAWGFAMGFVASHFNWLGVMAGIIVTGILYAIESLAVDAYTKGKLELQVERPQPYR